MLSKTQLIRDIICGLIIMTFALLFFICLAQYLQGLQKPYLLISAFSVSLVVSCIFEVRHTRNREGFAAVAVTTVLFTAGLLLADYYRLYYVDLLSRVDEIKGAKEILGQEYLYLTSSKIVGYGGAYGAGLVTTRLIGRTSLLKAFTEHLILSEYRIETCHHCQQSIT